MEPSVIKFERENELVILKLLAVEDLKGERRFYANL